MNEIIYCDNAATTKIRPEVLEAMQPYLTNNYGNASSEYDLGAKSKTAIEESRETIANMLNVTPEEIFFTSGGSEANTWALTRVTKCPECAKDGVILTTPTS